MFFIACNNSSNSASALVDLDLMKYNLPVKIKAPADAVVESNDLGFVQDVTVKGEGNYYVQIIGGTATTFDIQAIKENHINDVRRSDFFGEIIQEDDNGFIYQKKISGDRINYDFRMIRIQGDQEFVFQSGLIGKYSLKDIERMYNAVK